jgi:hypothetical protein
MKTLLTAIVLVSAACSPFNAYRPNIDLNGVDLNRYEADMRNCETSTADAGFSFGNPIAECMVKRGYRINHTYQ